MRIRESHRVKRQALSPPSPDLKELPELVGEVLPADSLELLDEVVLQNSVKESCLDTSAPIDVSFPEA